MAHSPTFLTKLTSAHDRITSAGFALSQICLFVIVFAYAYETVSRYFFAAPTWWSNEVVSYALCVGTFLAIPEITRRQGHITITFLIERLSPRAAAHAHLLIGIVSGATCLLVAWICLRANILHVTNGEMLVRVKPIPKILLSVWLTYGFVSSGIYFLRLAVTPAQHLQPATKETL